MKRILILATLATLLFPSCKHTDKEKAEITRFLVTSPLSKDTLILREYVCQIQSSSHIELRSQEKGYLQNIYVDEGQFVRKGQLMFRIMPLLYQAEMQKARAEKNFAEIEYQNTRSLADSNIVSANELLLSRAKLDKARAELALAQAHLDLTEIRAPFDGIMDRFHKRQGSLVDESELLTTLSDNRKMWVYFNVPEAEYLDYSLRKRSQTEEKVSLQMANKQLYPQNGVVETIEADFNNETGNIAFRAGFPNPNGILRHGETGNILMPVSFKNALIIPQKASFEILDKKYVYVIDKDSTVRSREITVGAEMPHLYVVSSGLQAGDRILLEGLRKVSNNERISYAFVEPEKVISELHELHAE
ncbi:efflux RND transporter periplasmic adaptor subunit [Flavihumibacter sp. ZG627]|uniref:efflux RND transporter periplasmic adaptor subunit n=1 Tax=Flavihumibacter sp. ZG627 TaxID=1463156 RepID=UPI00057E2C38|nr:efflux RND transporter periplasmic adaptor subunit [Flavihumibacter sp. ZG627]KIC90081.1 hemolysin D [Flavihumibacter sp. ZG627]